MIDYEILKLIWWLFIAVLLTGFAIMDGQDMGAGTLLPFLGKTNEERRIMINAVAPHWDGNEVWLLTGAGAMFAAWPIAYATAFSGFYWALLIVLFMLIFRPVAFDYRSKVDSTKWRTLWDTLLFLGSAVPPIICGVAFGNLLQGVPFRIDTTMRVYYEGSFFALLNPFALLCGVVSIAMVIMHGANYLALKTEGDLQARSARVSTLSSAATFVLFALAGIWLAMAIPGYTATGLDPAGFPNPLAKSVAIGGSWFDNLSAHPYFYLLPALGLLGSLLSIVFGKAGKWGSAIVASSVALLGIVLTPFVTMFPFVMPSSLDPVSSLTLWDCTSSQLTLEIMFFVTLIFLPLVVIYTSWAYHVMRGKVTHEYVSEKSHSLY